MATKTFLIGEEKTDELQLKWGFNYANFTVFLNGEQLGSLETKSQLSDGYDFDLGNSNILHVELRRRWLVEELELLLDGEPLPGSTTDPTNRIKTAFYVLAFIAGLNLVLGLTAEQGNIDVLKQVGFGYASAVEGLIFLILAWMGRYRLSATAFYIAIALIVGDGVLLIISNPNSALGNVFMRAYFVIAVLNGIAGIKALKRQMLEDSLAE